MLNEHQRYNKDLYVTLWFIPLMMCLFSILLAYGILYLDLLPVLNGLKQHISTLIGTEAFKHLLTVSSTSVITIVTITFSITILTLSIAANQLGPRLLPSFLEKKITQFTLGYLIGTFIYNMIVLQSISVENIFNNPPVLSVAVAFGLSIFSLIVFILFIHFSSHVIQVDNALESLAKNLIDSIYNNNPAKNGDTIKYQSKSGSNFEKIFDSLQYEKSITDERTGYLQYINYEKLLQIAMKKNLKINILVKPGDFCFRGRPLMIVKRHSNIDIPTLNTISQLVYFGKRRTTKQDIEFGFEMLVEIALRALSPGINNPYTAIHCLDRISEGIVATARVPLRKEIICNQNMEPIIQHSITTYQSLINIALNQIRQKAKGDVAVTIYMLQIIGTILKLDQLPAGLIDELQVQKERIYDNSKLSDIIQDDRNDIKYYYDKIIK